jgi:hypothetical protein
VNGIKALINIMFGIFPCFCSSFPSFM